MKAFRDGLIFLLCIVLLNFARVQAEEQAVGAPDPSAQLGVKLKSIVVSIDFTNATINQAVRALTDISKRKDPDHRGIGFVVMPGASETGRPVTLKLDDVPVGVAVRYVCELSRLRYKVDEHLVSILPEAGEVELTKRTFHVDPSFVK